MADSDGWLHPRKVLAMVVEAFGAPGHATTSLVSRLVNGLIQGRATKIVPRGTAQTPGSLIVPTEHWRTASRFLSYHAAFWQSSDLEDVKVDARIGASLSYFGVRLRADQVYDLIGGPPKPSTPEPYPGGRTWVSEEYDERLSAASAPAAPPQVQSTVSKGGRPPKKFWEALWIEMACQVWAGEIGPESKQAEIQKAMEAWVAEHDREARGSPATFRNAARALLQALQAKKGKNSSG
jgi:hypothetical protein